MGFAEGFQGPRKARKQSLLGVNEHFEPERNAEITRKAQPEGREDSRHNGRMGFVEGFQGPRKARKRSLLGVNELFEPEHNAEITRKAQPEGREN